MAKRKRALRLWTNDELIARWVQLRQGRRDPRDDYPNEYFKVRDEMNKRLRSGDDK